MEQSIKATLSTRTSAEKSDLPKCCRCGELSDRGKTACEACRDRAVRLAVESAGVPPRLHDDSWKLPAWAENRSPGKGLFLHGKSGVGKSATCCMLLVERTKQWFESWDGSRDQPEPMAYRFISYPMFVMRLQDSYARSDADQTAYRLIRAACEAPLLVIDDLGAEKLTDFVRQATYALVNEREQWNRTTYVTSNYSVRQIADQIDSRIASRIAGMCDVVEITGRDRRTEEKTGQDVGSHDSIR